MSDTYTKTAVTLHWLIGIAIIGLLVVGLTMEDAPDAFKPTIYMVHKSLGLSVLVLSFVRLFWRLAHPAPALPDTMKKWEVIVSKLTHTAFYILMIGLPLSGWALVSAAPAPYDFPINWFGLFEWPKITILTEIENKKEVAHSFGEVHEVLANVTIALLVLHIGAALKHHFVLKDGILARMIPCLKKDKE